MRNVTISTFYLTQTHKHLRYICLYRLGNPPMPFHLRLSNRIKTGTPSNNNSAPI